MNCIVDYGIGNIQAFFNLFKSLGIDAKVASSPESLSDATRLILPGVGHFDQAMQKLNNSGLRSKLQEMVLGNKVPVMGICVGMQMLAYGSDEGVLPGLGWVPGQVKSFSTNSQSENLPMPHMGWNTLQLNFNSKLFSKGFQDGAEFYFLHSYFFDAEDKTDVVASAYYGLNFDAVISRGHIHGVQFHPEKSHHWGEKLLKNFVEF